MSMRAHAHGCAPLVRILTIACLIVAAPLSSQAQTRELLNAPRVKSRIRIRTDPRTHEMSYAVDDDRVFRVLPARPVFRLSGTISIAYAEFNPLRVRVAVASATAAGGAIQRSTGALETVAFASSTAIPRLPVPASTIAAAATSCAMLDGAVRDGDVLTRSIYSAGDPLTFGELFDGWRTAIDRELAGGRSGADAIGNVVGRMREFVRDMTAALEAAGAVVVKLGREIQESSSADSCQTAAAGAYRAMRLTNPSARIQQLAAISSLAAELSDMLAAEYGPAASVRWQGGDYVIRDAAAPGSDVLRMILTIDATDFDVRQPAGVAMNQSTSRVTATIELRRTSRFVREFGLGTAVSSIVRPKYGTSSNAQGQTVVARMPPGKISFAPMAVANLTCLCDTGPFVTPMLQAGVTTSFDAPGLFAGGGVRVFGVRTGDVAVGAGWIRGWVQDLKTLRVGDRVGGTIDIDRDLGLNRRDGWYLLAQYKF
jgi:hypothetical protein